MPKKITPKTLPGRLAPLFVNPSKQGNQEAQLKAFFEQHNAWIEWRKRWAGNLHARYRKTGNPLACWDAYSLARKKGEPIPEWVLAYFDRAARNLLSPKNEAKDVPRCLEFSDGKTKGGHGSFAQYDNYLRRRAAVSLVIQELNGNLKLTLQDACESVARQNPKLMIDALTLKKWYYQTDF